MNETIVRILTDRIPDNDNFPLVYYREDELKVKQKQKIMSKLLRFDIQNA